MKVSQLKSILNEALELLEDYEDDQEVNMVSNTYFLGHPSRFLGIAGYNGGYISLSNPVKTDEDEEDD